jgi:hypothetical protein
MENQNKLIEHFKQAIGEVWIKDSQSTWPIDPNAVAHLFMDIFVTELLEDFQRLKSNNQDDPAIAARLKTSARILRLIMPCVPGMKACGMPPEAIREKVLYFLSLAKHLKYGDLSNRDGKNIVLAPGAWEDKIKMVAADKSSSSVVHKLSAILWNYAECLFFRTHGFVREFHGPYYFPGKKEELLVRDFIDLRPLELWESSRPVEYENIRIVTAYRDLGMSIDIYNNVSIRENTTYVNSLQSYYLEADGKMLDLDEVNRLYRVLSEVMLKITSGVETFDWRLLAKKYAEIFWYSKKELKDGADWRPPVTVHERIDTGELNTRLQNLGPQSLQRMLRISF